MRVLIADDQRDVGRALANLVRICNHEIVDVVGSGLEAIHAYTRHRPDLVLMDYRMPKLNGATACRNILSKDPAARVILVTAWSPSDEASQSGALSVLPKPVSLQQLEATLNRVAETVTPDPPEPIPDFLNPVSDLPASNFDLATSIPYLPTSNFDLPTPISSPSDEVALPSDGPVPGSEASDQPPPPELCAIGEGKIPGKRRTRRRVR